METVIKIKSLSELALNKIADYIQLIKPRLSLLIVFSSAMAYLWATNRNVDTATIWLLSIGGFLITGSSNIFNQIIEKDSDKLMKRTLKRPLPDGRMEVKEVFILGLILGIFGLVILYKINLLSALLGSLAMLLYIFLYTLLKKITWLAVLPGAVAGSLPVIIGCVAATGEVTRGAFLLFSIQFIWQFPHTWSIAWLLNDEYDKAGIKIFPMKKKNKASAILILFSAFLIIPTGLLLYMYESAGAQVSWLLALAGIGIFLFAIRFYQQRTDKSAVGLMLSCFAYLPLVLILLVAEKFFL